MRPHPAALVLPLLAVLAAPAFAADATTKVFKKAAKSRLKEFNVAVKVALQPVKAELSGVASAYASGDLTAGDAVSQAAAGILAARDAIEDAAFDTALVLQGDGHQALLQDGVTEPGPDFQAGTQGVWDDALGKIGKAVDKSDKTLKKRWHKFTQSLAAAASTSQVALDLRASLPPHGTAWRGVPPPAALPATGTIANPPLVPPEVLVIARVVDTNTPDTLILGARAATPNVDVNVASTDIDEATLGTLTPDESGTALGSFALDTLQHPQGFVVVTLDDGTLTASSVAVSAPTLAEPDANSAAALNQFEKDLKAGQKALLKAASAAVKDFKHGLSTQLASAKAGTTTPEAALTSGFSSLATAHETIGLAWSDFVQNTSTKTSLAFGTAGVDDANIPADFQPDFAGPAGNSQATTLQKLGKKQAQLGTAFDGFTSKVVATSQTGSTGTTPIAASVVTSRGSGFSAPMITGAGNPALVPSTSTGLVDGLVLQTSTDGTPTFSAMLNVQADPLAVPSMSISSTSLPEASFGDMGDMTLSTGGTQTADFPLSVDESTTGFTFNGGVTTTDQSSPMVLSTPTVATTTP